MDINRIGKLFQVANNETESGNYTRAIEAYHEIIDRYPEDERAVHMAYWGIGDIHLNNSAYEKAEYNFKKALELAPDQADYHYLLGCTYRYTEEIESSIHHLQRAVEIDDSKDIFWCELGWVVGHFRDPEKGIEHLKRAMSINPTNSKALTDMAMLYIGLKKWKEAQLCIEEAIKHDPYNNQIIEIQERLRFFADKLEKLTDTSGQMEAG